MARRGKRNKHPVALKTGTMTAYCCWWYGTKKIPKVFFRLRGINKTRYREIIADWKLYLAEIGRSKEWAGASLLIYDNQHDQVPNAEKTTKET